MNRKSITILSTLFVLTLVIPVINPQISEPEDNANHSKKIVETYDIKFPPKG